MARYGLRLSKISRLFKYMHKNLSSKRTRESNKKWLLIHIKQDNLIDLIRMKNSSALFFARAWNHKVAGAVCRFIDTRLRRYRLVVIVTSPLYTWNSLSKGKRIEFIPIDLVSSIEFASIAPLSLSFFLIVCMF